MKKWYKPSSLEECFLDGKTLNDSVVAISLFRGRWSVYTRKTTSDFWHEVDCYKARGDAFDYAESL